MSGDKDLFGHQIIHPMKAEQLPLFHEPNAAAPVKVPGETAEDRRIARKFAHTPTAEMFPAKPERKPPLWQRIRQDLDRRGIPYVVVDEAKRALFHSARIDTCFHLVIYSQLGSNWLLLAGEANEDKRQGMAEWERIFGDGFRAVLAVERAAGVVFRTLAGEWLDLADLGGREIGVEDASPVG